MLPDAAVSTIIPVFEFDLIKEPTRSLVIFPSEAVIITFLPAVMELLIFIEVAERMIRFPEPLTVMGSVILIRSLLVGSVPPIVV